MTNKKTKTNGKTNGKKNATKHASKRSGGGRLLEGSRLADGTIDGSRGFWIGGECGADE